MDRLASLLTEINPDHCPRLARIGKVKEGANKFLI